jgi:hypothetical protein
MGIDIASPPVYPARSRPLANAITDAGGMAEPSSDLSDALAFGSNCGGARGARSETLPGGH